MLFESCLDGGHRTALRSRGLVVLLGVGRVSMDDIEKPAANQPRVMMDIVQRLAMEEQHQAIIPKSRYMRRVCLKRRDVCDAAPCGFFFKRFTIYVNACDLL